MALRMVPALTLQPSQLATRKAPFSRKSAIPKPIDADAAHSVVHATVRQPQLTIHVHEPEGHDEQSVHAAAAQLPIEREHGKDRLLWTKAAG